MKKYDVVYILQEDAGSEELRYSLRSIEKNMTHGKVWFYCGKPEGLHPDEYVAKRQHGFMKWEKAKSSLIEACMNDQITDKFWLFNDDFFVLKRMTSTKPLFDGSMRDHILQIEYRYDNKQTGYTKMLRATEAMLEDAGCSTFNYAIHVPMLIDREGMLETLQMFPSCPMFRCLYGNYQMIGGTGHEDVKIREMDVSIPEGSDFVSTDDDTFAQGKVGKEIRSLFKEKCKYE